MCWGKAASLCPISSLSDVGTDCCRVCPHCGREIDKVDCLILLSLGKYDGTIRMATGKRRKRDAARGRSNRKRSAEVKAPAAKALSLTPIRTSFYKRALKIVARLAATAPEERLTEALGASTDAGALARALSDSDLIGPAVQELEPLAALIAKGAEHKQELIAEAGGLLTTAEVAELLGISRQAVWKQRQERKLLSITHGGEEKFPAIQYTRAGEVLPGLSRVLAAISLRGGWGTLDFLVTPDDDELDGLSPIEVLKQQDPDRLEDLVRLASTQGEHGPG